MIVTDRMVFLHLHKSGGTFVNKLLLHCVPGASRVGYHFPYREVPSCASSLPIVGSVRSPWAYYVSWFHFQLGLPRPNALFAVASDDGRLGFSRTVANLVTLARDETRLLRLEAALPDDYRPSGANLIKRDVADLRAWNGGFYSFLYHRLYAGAEAPIIIRTEDLRQELSAALRQVGHLPNPCISQFIADAPPFNVSRHDGVASYYGEELASLVAERDRLVIDRHGYAFSS